MKLIINHVTYEYDKGMAHSVKALDDITLTIDQGEFIGIAGHTGSGKSTLIQHFNGLLKPTEGEVYFEGEDIYEKKYDRKKLRRKIGMVFQYPEHQLFADTVFDDVCFGPKNLGYDRKQAELNAYAALKQVGLEDEYFYQAPFAMSGGQKRKAAIAGVLAIKPEIIILDEPTAGLDPGAQKDVLGILRDLHKSGTTVIMVSHNMDHIAEYAERAIVLDKGRKVLDGDVREVFAHEDIITKAGLDIPEMVKLGKELKKMGVPVPEDMYTYEEAKTEILKAFDFPV